MGQSAGRLFAGGSCVTPTCFNGWIDFCSDAQQQKGGVMVRRCGLEPPPPGQQPPLRSSKRVASTICVDAIPLPWRWLKCCVTQNCGMHDFRAQTLLLLLPP